MKKRQLGNSDLFISEMGLGCMSLGTDEKQARRIIEAALEAGINYFDTADLYDFGENETLVGKALKPVREQVILATKVGNRWNDTKDHWRWDPSKKYIKEAVKHSLKRLQTDYLDLYQLHGGTFEDPIEETIEAFEELKAEGLIRYYGISSIRPNVIRKFSKNSSIVSVMMQYSMLDRRPEEEALSLLQQSGISVVTRGSIAKGLLTDHFHEKVSDKGFLNYNKAQLQELLPVLKEKLATSRSLEAVALQYNLAHPAVASVVIGASSVEQVRANVQAVNSLPLTACEIEQIHSLTIANQYKDHR